MTQLTCDLSPDEPQLCAPHSGIFHFRLSANKEFCQHDEVPSNWNYGNCISNELESDSEREERIHFFYGSGISRTAINHISVSMQIRRDQNQTHQYKFGFC